MTPMKRGVGYHKPVTKDGQPLSKVFVKTTLADKQLVSVAGRHENYSRWSWSQNGREFMGGGRR